MTEQPLHLLIVDDEESIRMPLADHLRINYHYSVDTARDGQDALQLVDKSQGRYDVALIDQVLEGSISGLELLRELKTKYPEIQVIVFTGWGMKQDEGIKILDQGAYRYLAKPFNLEELALTIRFAAEQRRIRREHEYLSALVQVSKELTHTTDLEKQLALVWNYVKEQLATPTFFIALYDSATDTLQFHQSYDEGEPDPLPERYLGDDPSSWGLAGQVVKNRREEVWFSREQAEQEWLTLGIMPHVSGKGLSESGVCLPLRVGEKILGALSVQSYKPYGFDPALLNAVRALANQVAVAIENTRLIVREQEATHRMRKQADSLKVLYEIGKEIISAQEVGTIWDSIAKYLVRLVGARRSLFLLVDTKGKRLVKATGYGYPPEHLQRMTISEVEAGVSGWVLRKKQAVLIEDVRNDPRNTGMALERAKGFETAPLVVAPLLIKDDAIGTLTVANSVGDSPFDEDDKELVVMLAAQASIAYDNARKVRDLEHMYDAAKSIAGALELPQVLQQIVESACEILEAESSAIWSFADAGNQFIPEELVAYRIPIDLLEKFRNKEPKRGGTAGTVMERNWVGVVDILDPKYDFIGSSTMELLESIHAKSFQGIALKIGKEKLGVLYVNYNVIRNFTEEDRKTLETFAYHAAIALKKARLLEQVRKAQETAKVVAEVTVLEDKQVTLLSVAKGTQEAIGCDAVVLFEYDQITGKLEHPPVMAGVNYPDRARQYAKVVPGSIVYEILRREKTYVVEKISEDALFRNKRFALDENIQSCIAIPLKVEQQKVGIMFVNYRSVHRFTNDERKNIELFANQAAVAIRNARLLADIRHRNAQLQAISKISKSISTILDLEKLIDHAVNVIRDRLNLYYVGLFLVGEGGEYAILRGGTGEAGRNMLKDGHKLQINGLSMVGWSIANGQARIALNVAEESIRYDNPLLPKTQSEMALPLLSHNQCIGALSVQSTEKAAFTDEDIAVLQTMADQLTIAIENALQYEELLKTKGVLAARTALAWTGMVSSTWRHAITRDTVTIREQIKLLRGDLISLSESGTINKRLDMIERLSNRILEKPITAPLSAEEGAVSISLNKLIQKRVNSLWTHGLYKPVKLDLKFMLEDSATVRASPEWVQRALDILIDNAIDAMQGLPKPHLAISTRRLGDQAEILIRDNGHGIPAEVQKRLFQEPVRKSQGEKGQGMGLLFAQTIVQTYGGEIRVIETGAKGTAMVISLSLED